MGLPLGQYANDPDANTEVKTFVDVKPGTYNVTVEDITDTDDDGEPLVTSPDSPKYPSCPMVKWTFLITEEGPFEGQRMWRNSLLHPALIGYFIQMLVALGFDEAEITAEGYELDYNEVKGKDARIKVGFPKKRDSENPDRTEIKRLLPVGDEAKVPF
jgi:hypothetical protein